MPPELTTIAGTLAAALVAGLVSYWAGRGMKTHEWRLALAKEEVAARKALYASFLSEVQRLIIQSTEDKFHETSKLETLNQLYAEITLLGSTPVTEAAALLFDAVLLENMRDDITAEEAMEFHPRKQAFLKAAREELRSFTEV